MTKIMKKILTIGTLFIVVLFLITANACRRSPERIAMEKAKELSLFKKLIKQYFHNLNEEQKWLQINGFKQLNKYRYDEDKDFQLLDTDFPRDSLKAIVRYEQDLWFYDPHGHHFEFKQRETDFGIKDEGYFRRTKTYKIEQVFVYDGELKMRIPNKIEPAEMPWRGKKEITRPSQPDKKLPESKPEEGYRDTPLQH